MTKPTWKQKVGAGALAAGAMFGGGACQTPEVTPPAPAEGSANPGGFAKPGSPEYIEKVNAIAEEVMETLRNPPYGGRHVNMKTTAFIIPRVHYLADRHPHYDAHLKAFLTIYKELPDRERARIDGDIKFQRQAVVEGTDPNIKSPEHQERFLKGYDALQEAIQEAMQEVKAAGPEPAGGRGR